MSQSRLGSLAETFVSMVAGFWLSVMVQLLVFPLYGFSTDLQSNMEIVAIFTFVSMIRSYVLRRIFNWFSTREAACKAPNESIARP